MCSGTCSLEPCTHLTPKIFFCSHFLKLKKTDEHARSKVKSNFLTWCTYCRGFIRHFKNIFHIFFFLISAILSWECEVSLKWKTGLWTYNRFIRSFSYVYSPPPPFHKWKMESHSSCRISRTIIAFINLLIYFPLVTLFVND